MSETDKTVLLKSIEFCLNDIFNFAYKIQDYMSGTRDNEFYEAVENGSLFEGDGTTANSSICLFDNVFIPDNNIISTLPEEEQNIINNIFYDNNIKYKNMCKGKSDASRRTYLNKIKNNVKSELYKQKIDSKITNKLVNNIQYKNLSNYNCKQSRYLW